MSLTKLVLIVKKSKNGKEVYQRIDTDETIDKRNIEMVKQPPIIIPQEFPYDNLPIYIWKARIFRDKANALIVGEPMGNKDVVFYPLSYCRIIK
jgi:hypothetical protein